MNDDPEIANKKKEIKGQLELSEFRWIFEKISENLSILTGSTISHNNSLSFTINTMCLFLVICIFGFFITFLNDGSDFLSSTDSIDWTSNPHVLLGTLAFLLFAGIQFAQLYKEFVFKNFKEIIIDSMISVNDLEDFQSWANQLSNITKPIFIGILFAVLAVSISIKNPFDDLGSIFIFSWVTFFGGALFYYFIPLMILPYKLSKYEFKLYAMNPRCSVIIYCLSYVLNRFVIFASLLAAISMGCLVLLNQLRGVDLFIFLLVSWIPLLILFAGNHYFLGKIIIKKKWKTLLDIQNKIEQTQEKKGLADQEKIVKVNHLMDHYDRVLKSPNSTAQLRSVLEQFLAASLPIVSAVLIELVKYILNNFNS